MANHPSGPGLIETPAERAVREHAEEKSRDSKYRKIQLWFNGILMLATIVTAGIVLYQNRVLSESLVEMREQSQAMIDSLEESKKQTTATRETLGESRKQSIAAQQSADAARIVTDLTRDHFLKEQRPYLLPISIRPQFPIAAGRPMNWRISYLNYGQSPAINAGIVTRVFYGADPMAEADAFFAALGNRGLRDSTTAVPPTIRGERDANFLNRVTPILSEGEFKFIMTTDFAVVIVGRIEYEDLAGNFYRTDFCRMSLITGALANCRTHNEIQ